MIAADDEEPQEEASGVWVFESNEMRKIKRPTANSWGKPMGFLEGHLESTQVSIIFFLEKTGDYFWNRSFGQIKAMDDYSQLGDFWRLTSRLRIDRMLLC